MSILNLRPNPDMNLSEIPYILEQLNIMDNRNNNNEHDEASDMNETLDEHDNSLTPFGRRNQSAEERALAPRISSLENSLVEHINSSVPSADELVIRQRGRKKLPAKISWSPVKSPFKTPTKRNSTLHMSLLSPSPAKKLFNNTSPMLLRSSPRKRILYDNSSFDQDPSTSSTPVTTPSKRLKFFDDRSMNASNNEVPIRTLLKGLSQEQLIQIICDVSAKDSVFEDSVRKNLPSPDVRAFEDQLNSLRKNVTRNSPRSRLLSRTDGTAYTKVATHLTAFKKAICNHCKILTESQHFDALIDYILMAWTYVRTLPVWDEANHNLLRRECFKILTLNAKLALKNGGMKIGDDRISNFMGKLKLMVSDYEEVGKCEETLSFLSNTSVHGY